MLLSCLYSPKLFGTPASGQKTVTDSAMLLGLGIVGLATLMMTTDTPQHSPVRDVCWVGGFVTGVCTRESSAACYHLFSPSDSGTRIFSVFANATRAAANCRLVRMTRSFAFSLHLLSVLLYDLQNVSSQRRMFKLNPWSARPERTSTGRGCGSRVRRTS